MFWIYYCMPLLLSHGLFIWVLINLFMSFCSICTLFWDDITIICWGKLSKQTTYWSKTGFFSQLKSKQYFQPKLSWYHPKIRNENIVQKNIKSTVTLVSNGGSGLLLCIFFLFFVGIMCRLSYTLGKAYLGPIQG